MDRSHTVPVGNDLCSNPAFFRHTKTGRRRRPPCPVPACQRSCTVTQDHKSSDTLWAQNLHTHFCPSQSPPSLNFKFQILKLFGIKKFEDRDIQAAAQLKDREDPRILGRTVDDVHQGRQGHRGAVGQSIVGDSPCLAVIVDTFCQKLLFSL